MTQKFTPGPWDMCKPARNWLVYPEAARNDGIDYFLAEIIRDELPEEQCKANAQLIAAAPELLAALQSTLSLLKVFTRATDDVAKAVWDQAEAAITKATPSALSAEQGK